MTARCPCAVCTELAEIPEDLSEDGLRRVYPLLSEPVREVLGAVGRLREQRATGLDTELLRTAAAACQDSTARWRTH